MVDIMFKYKIPFYFIMLNLKLNKSYPPGILPLEAVPKLIARSTAYPYLRFSSIKSKFSLENRYTRVSNRNCAIPIESTCHR